MKACKHYSHILAIITSILILTNCVSINQPELSAVETTPTSPIVTASPIPTKIKPSDTPPVPVSPQPTLAADEALVQINRFLQNKPNCALPCWLGITPGISSVTDVQALLTAFSGVAERTFMGKAGEFWQLGALSLQYPKPNLVIEIYSTFLTPNNDDRVSIISVDTQALPESLIGQIYGDPAYIEFMSPFLLPQILSTYGTPDEIFVTADIYEYEQSAPDYFEVRLLYPDKGIYLRYQTPAEKLEDMYEICLLNSFVDLWLLEPDQGTSYQARLLSLGDEWGSFFTPSEFNKTTVEAFGLDTDEFIQASVSSPTKCLLSPVSIWPER